MNLGFASSMPRYIFICCSKWTPESLFSLDLKGTCCAFQFINNEHRHDLHKKTFVNFFEQVLLLLHRIIYLHLQFQYVLLDTHPDLQVETCCKGPLAHFFFRKFNIPGWRSI